VALNAQILLQVLATETVAADLATSVRTTSISQTVALTDGTGASQAQLTWSDSRSILPASDDILDVSSLADDRGTVQFTAVKAIYLRNTGTVSIYWDGNADWDTGPQKTPDTSRMEIPAGGIYLATNASADGWAVGASAEYVTIENGDPAELETATYDLVIVGEGSIT
jgi:hypothetical protein